MRSSMADPGAGLVPCLLHHPSLARASGNSGEVQAGVCYMSRIEVMGLSGFGGGGLGGELRGRAGTPLDVGWRRGWAFGPGSCWSGWPGQACDCRSASRARFSERLSGRTSTMAASCTVRCTAYHLGRYPRSGLASRHCQAR